MKVSFMIGFMSLFITSLSSAALTAGDLINVSFAKTGATAVTGAAVVGESGDVWNNIYAGGGAYIDTLNPFSLNLADGSGDSDIDLNFSVSGAAMDGNIHTGNLPVFHGTLYVSNRKSTFTLSDFNAGAVVNLTLYGGSDNGQDTKFTFGSDVKTANNDMNPETSYLENDNYVVFSNVTAFASGMIRGSFEDVSTYGAFNGMQIEVVDAGDAALQQITNITATASSVEGTRYPANLVNESDFDGIWVTSVSPTGMWNTAGGVNKADTWVKFDLGTSQNLGNMWVFNYNDTYLTSEKRRFITADVWISPTGITTQPTDAVPGDWVKLHDDQSFSEAPYSTSYSDPQKVEIMKSTRYVLMNDIVNGGATQWGNSYGLSEVLFYDFAARGTMVIIE